MIVENLLEEMKVEGEKEKEEEKEKEKEEPAITKLRKPRAKKVKLVIMPDE